jgi:hypothetical protein
MRRGYTVSGALEDEHGYVNGSGAGDEELVSGTSFVEAQCVMHGRV